MSNDFNLDFEQPTKQPQKEINLDDYIVVANEVFPDLLPILLQGDVPLLSAGEISLITGDAKTKKTYLVSWFIAMLLGKTEVGFSCNLQGNILLIDTEQGRKRTNNVVRRIHRLLNWNFEVPIQNLTAFSIRELSANERFAVLEQAIEKYNPSIVFLDGLADLIQNTNDLEECSRKISLLMKLAEQHNTHVCSAVHTNPSSEKTRGHVGSELQRKCETVMLLKKDGNTSTVSPQYCRNKEFERFSFFINSEGFPETCELPPLGIQAQILFASVFGNLSEINYSDLCQMIMEKEGILKRSAERKIRQAVEKNILKKNAESGYSLNKI
ncbi:MAG: AAA family ATPase [Bacteroidales bacterium]|jgi:hypothetical protein|nr:AAA family ATPase [Bacteroidales bacterium]